MLGNDPVKIKYLPHCRNASTLTSTTLENSFLSSLSTSREDKIIFSSRPLRTVEKDDLYHLEKEHKKVLVEVNRLMNEKEVSKHEKIRLKAWIQKLAEKQKNPVWKKNVIFYLQTLKAMLETDHICNPFSGLPPEGALPNLTIYDLPYPLREKFSCSKEKSQHSKSRPRQSNSFLKKISKLKGHDFPQPPPLAEKKISVPLSKNISYFKIDRDQFCQNNLSQIPTARPVYSNTKLRKETIQKSNSNRGKQSKQQIEKAVRQQLFEKEYDKENNMNSGNINRQLFASKEKRQTKHNETLQTESGRNEAEAYREGKINWLKQSRSEDIMQTVEQQQQAAIYSQMYRLLLQNQATLSTQPHYTDLVHNIEQVGKKLNLPDFTQDDLDSSVLSEQSLAFLKASEELKHKFQQTSSETVEFMSFLHKMKQKQKPKFRNNQIR